MSDKLTTKVIQVTNIAPSCTKDQLRSLFGYLGRVKELEMFPPEGAEGAVTARVGYVEFDDYVTAGVALHLSSTVFIDRAITIVPVMDGKIPDESSAMQLTPSAVAGMLPGQPTWPANVVSQVTGLGANQVIMTNDPRLTSLGLPQYPPLPATTDPSKIEEIRRTVFISDLDPKVTPEMLLSFFSQTGEIKYIRMAGDENGPTRNAYIEFTDQRCIAQALSYNNVVFQGKTVSVKHATTGIVKPTPKSEASQREIEDAMKKVKEASKLISAAANSERETSRSPSRKRSKSKGRSRSRSKSKRHSRSRSPRRRRRSTSRSKRRSRSRRRSLRRSRSPRRRRSRSRSRRRSRTRSPVRRRRSRTPSKSRRKSRTPPKSYSRSRRSHSRSRKSRSRDRKEKTKDRKKSKSMSPPTLVRELSPGPGVMDKDSSPVRGLGSRTPSPPKARKRSPTPKLRSPTPKIRSPTPKRRSPTPKRRSRTPKRRSRTPKRRSPTPKRRSPTPKRRSRTKSPSRRKRRSSVSRRRSRSRSGSRHRSRRDRKRSRSRDRKHDSSKKKSTRDKDEKRKETSKPIKRDYDEEEKGFASEGSEERENSERGGSEESSSALPGLDKDTDHQAVDMDMSD